MEPKMSRRGWLGGVFAALLAWRGRRRGAAAAPPPPPPARVVVGPTCTYTYDAGGRLTSTTDTASPTFTFVYDAAGRRLP